MKNILSSNDGLMVFDRCANGQAQVVIVPEGGERIILYFSMPKLIDWMKIILTHFIVTTPKKETF